MVLAALNDSNKHDHSTCLVSIAASGQIPRTFLVDSSALEGSKTGNVGLFGVLGVCFGMVLHLTELATVSCDHLGAMDDRSEFLLLLGLRGLVCALTGCYFDEIAGTQGLGNRYAEICRETAF